MPRFARLAAALLLSVAPLAAQAPEAEPTPLDVARKAFAAGEWATAVAAYEQVSAAQPANPLLKMRIGQCYAKLERWAEAAAALDLAVQGGAPLALFTVDHAGSYARLGQADKAVAVLQAAVQNGFAQPEAIQSSPNLASLAGHPGFAAAVTGADKNARPCRYDDDARAFDFWVGDWDVTVQGAPAGTSHVELILEGCVVFENWTATVGGTGKSFNLWDKSRQRWQQTWVDNRGTLLELHGTFTEPGKLVYENHVPGPDGKGPKNRMTFTRLGPDQVRQLWEQSTDGGATWVVTFDGDYRRKK